MAYVITEPCLGTCDTSCVKVCPVDCIKTKFEHGRKTLDETHLDKLPDADRKKVVAKLQLYIDPEVCIDCGACEPECPVDAIFEADQVPAKWKHYIKVNADFFGR
jgi:NAD-dependent dihydropyrimidine dehydrogenase PreA subunit